jgi:hypothetical protein
MQSSPITTVKFVMDFELFVAVTEVAGGTKTIVSSWQCGHGAVIFLSSPNSLASNSM